GPIASTEECMESCFAQTPMTAAEKRCARSATTVSSSALERSVVMQAMSVERTAKEVSTGDDAPPRATRSRIKPRIDQAPLRVRETDLYTRQFRRRPLLFRTAAP